MKTFLILQLIAFCYSHKIMVLNEHLTFIESETSATYIWPFDTELNGFTVVDEKSFYLRYANNVTNVLELSKCEFETKSCKHVSVIDMVNPRSMIETNNEIYYINETHVSRCINNNCDYKSVTGEGFDLHVIKTQQFMATSSGVYMIDNNFDLTPIFEGSTYAIRSGFDANSLYLLTSKKIIELNLDPPNNIISTYTLSKNFDRFDFLENNFAIASANNSLFSSINFRKFNFVNIQKYTSDIKDIKLLGNTNIKFDEKLVKIEPGKIKQGKKPTLQCV